MGLLFQGDGAIREEDKPPKGELVGRSFLEGGYKAIVEGAAFIYEEGIEALAGGINGFYKPEGGAVGVAELAYGGIERLFILVRGEFFSEPSLEGRGKRLAGLGGFRRGPIGKRQERELFINSLAGGSIRRGEGSISGCVWTIRIGGCF